MEDFGYKKSGNTKISVLVKKSLLLAASLFSIACFLFVTLLAYRHFYGDKNSNVRIIESPQGPIKVFAKHKVQKKDHNQLIYRDILEKKKASDLKPVIIKSPEPKKPPQQNKPIIYKANSAQNNKEVKKDKIRKNNEQIIVFAGASERSKSTTIFDREADLQKAAAAKKKASKRRIRIKVQIAALTSMESARVSWKKMSRLYSELFYGYKHYIQKVDLGKRGVFYRLQIGDFYNQVKAEEFCRKYIAKSQKTSADCIIVE